MLRTVCFFVQIHTCLVFLLPLSHLAVKGTNSTSYESSEEDEAEDEEREEEELEEAELPLDEEEEEQEE